MTAVRERVAVTGLGLVTALGNDADSSWKALVAGRSGVDRIDRRDCADLPVRIGAQVRGFDPAAYIEQKDIKKTDPFSQYAIAAAQMAIDDAGLVISDRNAEQVGVLVGTAIGGIETIEKSHRAFLDGGVKKISPFFIPRLIANMAGGNIAIRFGAKGVNYCTATACSSGAHAIGEAFRQIRHGYLEAAIAGGAEAGITPMAIAGFAAMRALSTRNDEPARACRPFDRERDGMVLGEGAGILVLERMASAIRRGARIHAEIVGYGANADAYHITSPSPDGEGAARCMALALRDAEIDPSEVDYINAHGTSTRYNDVNETQAIKRVFGETAARVAISSSKSMTGHTLGAAGGIEAAFTVQAITSRTIPPTINYESPDPECDLDYCPNAARSADLGVAVSNSFGFGGTNACLVFRRI